MSKYEVGFSDCTVVVDEIIEYVGIREAGSVITPTIRLDGTNMILQVLKDGELFLEKLIHIVINKSDMVLDEEIRAEYVRTFHLFLQNYFADTTGVMLDMSYLISNTYMVSAWTHE
jgi:GTP:adenosylcobinamide-phosphate guanylyltransferase